MGKQYSSLVRTGAADGQFYRKIMIFLSIPGYFSGTETMMYCQEKKSLMYELLDYSLTICSWHLHAKSLQSCLSLFHPMDCSPPDSSVHRIIQARTP